MDRVVRPMGSRDQKLWIENRLIIGTYDVRRHRVHVMDVDSVMNLKTFNAKVAAKISSNYLISDLFPLPRSVESLVHPPIEPES